MNFISPLDALTDLFLEPVSTFQEGLCGRLLMIIRLEPRNHATNLPADLGPRQQRHMVHAGAAQLADTDEGQN